MKKVAFDDKSYISASHESASDPGVYKKVMLDYRDFNSASRVQMINWAKLPKGKSFISHYHEDMDEVFIIISGKVKIYIDTDEEILDKGDVVLVSMKSIHKMENIGKVDVEYIVIGFSLKKGGKTVITGK